MVIDAGLLASQTKPFEFTGYVRVFPSVHATTPLGCAPGNSRFGGLGRSFSVLYAARDLATALAETVIRDRFQGSVDRRLFVAELSDYTAVQLRSSAPLRLVDLRKGGCLKLGVSTDIASARLFSEAQQFSHTVYNNGAIDGILYASRLTSENCIAIFDRVIASHLNATDIAPVIQLKQVSAALNSLNVKLIR